MSKSSLSVFFSYSHKDEILRDELADHLATLKRNGEISAWHDRMIAAGSDWAKAIDDNLMTADVILLLISSSFLASDYCSDIELNQAIARHNSGEARIIPIILRPCDWEGSLFGRLQALPKNAKPITKWDNKDEAFTDVVKGIKLAIAEMQKAKTTPVAPVPTTPKVEPVVERVTPQPHVNVNPVELLSAKGIDYRELEKLLKAKEWQNADKLTYRLMLKVANREKEGWLELENIKNFPCEDLLTLDRLWVHYSIGLYGFSVQKEIYVECGGKLDFRYPSDEIWDKLCDRTAWKSEGKWLDYPDQFFLNNFIKAKGHLPWRWSFVWGDVEYSEFYGSSFLASRLVKCKP